MFDTLEEALTMGLEDDRRAEARTQLAASGG